VRARRSDETGPASREAGCDGGRGPCHGGISLLGRSSVAWTSLPLPQWGHSTPSRGWRLKSMNHGIPRHCICANLIARV
jgi:hypothetical protein